MKLLFVTNNLYPYLNANSEIAYKLAAVLKEKHRCEVTLLGYSDKDRPASENPYGVAEYEMKQVRLARVIMARHENRIKKLFRLICHPSAIFYLCRSRKSTPYILADEYTRAIRRLQKRENFDAIVCFKNPNSTMVGAIRSGVRVPLIAYELDPWEAAPGQSDEDLLREQQTLERHFCAVMATPLLYREYQAHKTDYPAERVFAAEFPNMVPPPLSASAFSDGKRHIVFAGQLYEDIRNPAYTLRLLERLRDEDVILDLFGNDNGCLKGMDLPANVVYHGEVPSTEAIRFLQSADVVLNIGNTLLNQMPSKIITYFALGKPILNIVKSPECPTLPYMERYPLGISVVEDEEAIDRAAEEVKAFFARSVGKRVDFETVRAIYSTSTPESVGGLLYSVIEKCVSREEGRK